MITWFAEKISERLGIPKDEIEKELEIPPENFGDLALKIAFKLAKETNRNPQDVAEELKEKLRDLKYFSKIDVVNGYINFFFNWKNVLEDFFEYDHFKALKWENEKIIVEHTSVNPNKAWHVGHARNACLGDALVRLLNFFGNRVIVMNYIDDTGAQVADNLVGILFLGLPKEKEGVKFDKYQGDEVYTKVNEEYKKNPGLLEKRREILRAIEKGEGEVTKLARMIVNRILDEQLKTAERLNIFYDLLVKESDILKTKLWETSFEILKKIGKVVFETSGKNKGCWVFKDKTIGDKILVRSDGTVVYAGKDIAYAMWKHGLVKDTFKYKKRGIQKNGKVLWETTYVNGEEKHPKFNDSRISINVIDIRQSFEQDVVRKSVEIIGKLLGKEANYIHYAYEVVALTPETVKKLGKIPPEGVKVVHMSGRKGIYINVDDLLDKLKEVLWKEVKKRNPSLPDEKIEEISEKLAVSVLKFELLKYNPKKMIIFDLDSVLKVEEGNGIYVMYSYARACGILRKVSESIKFEFPTETSEEERKLAKKLLEFPTALRLSRKKLAPNLIAEYLTKLCTSFNRFYEKCSVVQEKDEKKKLFRVFLTKKFEETVKIGLELLGIEALERV